MMIFLTQFTLIVGGIASAPLGTFGHLVARTVSPDLTCGPAGTVGGSANQYTCPASAPCCSVNGFCGSTSDFCAALNCQPNFGTCNTTSTISPDLTCGPAGTIGGSANQYTCPTSAPCCSVNGFCGSTSDFCDLSNCQPNFGTCNSTAPADPTTCGPGVGSCGASDCCSLAGFCGTSEEYCEAPDCQWQFGPACDQNIIPPGTNTSSIARPRLGSIPYGGNGIYDCIEPMQIALTFDDGPGVFTSHVLDLLDQYGAKASFMVTANNNGKGQIDNTSLPWPAIIERMHSSGHQIVSHTWSHQDLCNITSLERKNEMWKNEMAIRNILGFFPTYMRPPYSDCTAECGCEQDMAELGYHITYFDVDTQDYLNDSPDLIQNSKDIFTAALATAPNTAWDVNDFLVIAHDIHNQTANNLTEFMLQGLLAGGYQPVTLGECLGDDPANWYRTDPSFTT